MAELSMVLINEHTLESVLSLVAELSHQVVRGAVAASVTVRGDGQPFTSNFSSELALDLDNHQYTVGRGPCVESLEKGIQVLEPVELHAEWADFRDAALKAGVNVVLATPLRVKDEVFGALNIYGGNVSAFGDEEIKNASAFADEASIVLTNALALAGAESVNAQLREALNSRDVIGQAKGILMERRGLTSDQAFEVLRQSSQRENRKLFEVATELVEGAARPVGSADA